MNFNIDNVKPGDIFIGVGPHKINIRIDSTRIGSSFRFTPLIPNDYSGGWDGSGFLSIHWLNQAKEYRPIKRVCHLPEWF